MLGFLVPVVRIRALPQPGLLDLPAVLGRVSRALADLLGERPEGTWATWETIGSGHHSAERGNVFVTYEEARSGRLYDGGRVVKRASEE